MESLGSLHSCSHPFRLPLLTRRPSFRTSFPSKTPPISAPLKFSAVRASSSDPLHQNNPRNPKPLKTLTPILKSACVTLSAAVALLLVRFQLKPAMAAPVPSPQVESASSTSVDEQEKKPVEPENKPVDEQLTEQTDDVTLLLSLMEIKIKEKKPQEAIQILDRLIKLEPEEDEYPVLKASLYNYTGEFELAKEAFEQILEKDPLCVEAYHGLVVASAESEDSLNGVMRRVKAAMEVCRLKNMESEVRDFKLLIAQMEAVEGNYGGALKIHDELVKEEPGDFRPYLCQGVIYTLQGKNDEAEEKFRRYRELVPENHPQAELFDENALLTNLLQNRN